jgi:Lecithin:cholesterol acyltransferase
MARRPMPDVLVLVPGITGSVLQKDGRDVWAVSGGAVVQALRSLGRSVQDLTLPPGTSALDDLGDGVTAPRLVSDVHLIPGLWKIDGYSSLAAAVERRFDVRAGENLFTFPYDWRRDNRAAAHRLARDSHDWLRAWRQRSGNSDARLIILAHSMGGLVARYFLEPLDGWASTRMLITFGTPYRGSLNALEFVANGLRRRLGPVTLADLSQLLRSFDSVYQLLPVYPCVDDGGGRLLRVTETSGIPNLDPARAVAARAFHEEIREAVRAHEQDQAYRDRRYAIHPIVGMFQPTALSARLGAGGLETLTSYPGEDQDGDGTVPRVSATPLELGRARREVYVATRHACLQSSRSMLDHVTGLLTGLDLDLDAYYGPLPTRLSLDVEDGYAAGEPVLIRVRPEDDETLALTATLTDAHGAVVQRLALTPADDGWWAAELGPCSEGAYRIVVGGEGTEPVADVFAVA